MSNIIIRKIEKRHEIAYGKYFVVIYWWKLWQKFSSIIFNRNSDGTKKIKIISSKFLTCYVSNLGTDGVSDKK